MKQGTAELILKKLSDGIEKHSRRHRTLHWKSSMFRRKWKTFKSGFYMIPAIDNSRENVIYINQGQMRDDLSLFTTLAHEGYPGHLYQTIFYESTDPDPVRSIFNFGRLCGGMGNLCGNVQLFTGAVSESAGSSAPEEQLDFVGIYTLADIGIHYHGWSRADLAAFFSNYGIKDTAVTDRIYDLILGAPGNYLKILYRVCGISGVEENLDKRDGSGQPAESVP